MITLHGHILPAPLISARACQRSLGSRAFSPIRCADRADADIISRQAALFDARRIYMRFISLLSFRAYDDAPPGFALGWRRRNFYFSTTISADTPKYYARLLYGRPFPLHFSFTYQRSSRRANGAAAVTIFISPRLKCHQCEALSLILIARRKAMRISPDRPQRARAITSRHKRAAPISHAGRQCRRKAVASNLRQPSKSRLTCRFSRRRIFMKAF